MQKNYCRIQLNKKDIVNRKVNIGTPSGLDSEIKFILTTGIMYDYGIITYSPLLKFDGWKAVLLAKY